MAPRQLALRLWLAAAANCVHTADKRDRKIATAQICPQNAFVLAAACWATEFGRALTLAAEQQGRRSS